jgi:DNA-binding response OmpR family regulator
MASGHLLSFGPYVLDPAARRLTRDGAEVRIASRQLDLLVTFASRPGEVLSKDDLIKAGWGDVGGLKGDPRSRRSLAATSRAPWHCSRPLRPDHPKTPSATSRTRACCSSR